MMTYILTVDDSRIMRKIMSGAIEALGFQVLEAGDGAECLAQVEAHIEEVCLILMDWNMPNMDGLTALKRLKASELTNTIPVMMVTTEGERGKMVEAIRAGAANYLAKPFAEEDLMTKMVECLQDRLNLV
ncbi:MAG: response regulator [Candidatus Melainabacteria bacterium]|nr:response regulator [Candidatus Melainabacteria bacterium]